MVSEITKLSQEEFKSAMKQQIDNIGVNDMVMLCVTFEKLPGFTHAEKTVEICIEKNVEEDFNE
jgi:hypothetical protein